jgi:hypothetical protein
MDAYGFDDDTDGSLIDQVSDGSNDYFGISNAVSAPDPKITETGSFLDVINGGVKSLGVLAGSAKTLNGVYNQVTGMSVSSKSVSVGTEKHQPVAGGALSGSMLPLLIGGAIVLFLMRK